MSEAEVLQFTAQCLLVTLILSLPVLLVAAFFGVFVALLQALTQVQDQALAFVVKVIAVFVVLLTLTGTYATELYEFTLTSFNYIQRIK